MLLTLSPQCFLSKLNEATRDLAVDGLADLCVEALGRMGEKLLGLRGDGSGSKQPIKSSGLEGEPGVVGAVELVPGREKMERRSVGGWDFERVLAGEEVRLVKKL